MTQPGKLRLGLTSRSARYLTRSLIETRVERIFGSPASFDLLKHELHEVGVSICDRLFYAVGGGFLSGPDGVPSRAISVEARSACCDPVTEALARIQEIAMASPRRCMSCVRVMSKVS